MAYIVNKGYEFEVEVNVKLTNIVRGNTEEDTDLALMEMDRLVAGIEGIKEVHEGNWKVENGIATSEYKVVVSVTAHDYEDAFEEAEGVIEWEELPSGMTLESCEAVDYEWYNDTQYAIVGD